MSSQKSLLCKLKTQVIGYLYEMLDIKTIVNLTILNSVFKKPLNLKKNSIITYFYLQQLLRLYTKESFCYLLSNQSFHKKLLYKFSNFSEDDILKGKILAFANILEFYDYEIDFACLNYGQNMNLQIFYQIFKQMPLKYKEMACFKLTHINFFDSIFLENLEKLKSLEILLDNKPEKIKALNKFFDPVKFYVEIVELILINTCEIKEDSLKIINDYFEIHNNCLEKFIIEIKSNSVDLDDFSPILNNNRKSIKSLKIKGGMINYEKSAKFIQTLGELQSVETMNIFYDNQHDLLEILIAQSIMKLRSLKSVTCSLKFQTTKDIMYKIKYESVNYGEYTLEDSDLYNKKFFDYFISNENLLNFQFNFDNLNTNDKENFNLLNELTRSFETKIVNTIKIKSQNSDESYFIEFISSLKKLKNLKEISLDVMCVTTEFLEALEGVVRENKSIIKITNDTWANMSIQINPYFHFYFDTFSESILNIIRELDKRNKHHIFDTTDHLNNGIKIIIKEVDLMMEDEIFNEEMWLKYPELLEKINLISIDFDSLPEFVCENIKSLLMLTKNLKIFCLEKCELDDYGWQIIAEGISYLKGLNELKLFCTNVTDESCIELIKSIDSEKFYHLDLRGNEIGEESLMFILKNKSKFKNLIKLKFINNGSIETIDSLDDFADFMSNCKFLFNVELNKKIISCELDEKYNALNEKFNYLFLPY